MRNIHDPGEYHKYKSTSGGSGGGSGSPGCAGWIVIVIVLFMLISFIADGASLKAIETLLAFGIIAYGLAKWLSS